MGSAEVLHARVLNPTEFFDAAKEKLEIVSGAAPPPFPIFSLGIPRRRRRRNAFGLIQEYCSKTELKGFLEKIKENLIASNL